MNSTELPNRPTPPPTHELREDEIPKPPTPPPNRYLREGEIPRGSQSLFDRTVEKVLPILLKAGLGLLVLWILASAGRG